MASSRPTPRRALPVSAARRSQAGPCTTRNRSTSTARPYRGVRRTLGAVEPPRLVTPEAVVLSFETAGLGSRLLATLIDLVIQGGVLILGSVALALLSTAATGGTADVVATVLLLLLVTGVLLGYPIAFESLWRGRTPGKAAGGARG